MPSFLLGFLLVLALVLVLDLGAHAVSLPPFSLTPALSQGARLCPQIANA